MKSVMEKAKMISRVNGILQNIGGQAERAIDYVTVRAYEEAKGSGYGWTGIAEEDPNVILEVYPLIVALGLEWDLIDVDTMEVKPYTYKD